MNNSLRLALLASLLIPTPLPAQKDLVVQLGASAAVFAEGTKLCQQVDNGVPRGEASASCTGSWEFGSGTGAGTSQYGPLMAQAQSHTQVDVPQTKLQFTASSSQAYFKDRLTFQGVGGQQPQTYLKATIVSQGQVSGDTVGLFASTFVFLDLNGMPVSCGVVALVGQCSTSVPVKEGDHVDIMAINNLSGRTSVSAGQTGSDDFAATASSQTCLALVDGNGNPIPGASIKAQSGTNYPQ